MPPPPATFLTKLKVQLKLAVARLRLIQQRDETASKAQRRAMAQLMEVGKIDSARIRVENIIRSDILTELHEMLELYCELLLARAGLLEGPTCDPGLEEAVKTIIHAAPKTEIKELHQVRTLLAEKFGKEFTLAAMENAGAAVSEKVIRRLAVTPPREDLVAGYLEEIARAYGVDWPPGRLVRSSAGTPPPPTPPPPQIPLQSTPNSKPGQPDEPKLDQIGATSPCAAPNAAALLTVTPPRMTTDNIHPKVTLNSIELKMTARKPDRGAGASGPDLEELERRFAALKRS